MTVSRRNFLKFSGLAVAATAATSCGVAGRQLAQNELPDVIPPVATAVPNGPTTTAVADIPSLPKDPVLRLLNRAGYGPRPGDLANAQELGLEAYLEEQLDPDSIDDTAADLARRGLTTAGMDISQLVEMERRDVSEDLIANAVIGATMSKRQVYEAMVEFWSDHFNIFIGKNEIVPALKLVDDREVIRPNALGKFRDLLWASAQSPAMLFYLDQLRSTAAAPNENYARELMELHTLGVYGGYTQDDVMEVARALTGMAGRRRGPRAGQFWFDDDVHDFGEKTVLGVTLPAGQNTEKDLNQVLEILVTHPSTASFIAYKLVRRFVADEPPTALVNEVASTYIATDGDIKSMLRVIFLSDTFASAPAKLKRPYTYVASALRALNATARPTRRGLSLWLLRMGQPLFAWPPPDGYPDTSNAWGGNLLPRWNFSLALMSNSITGVELPLEEIVQAGNANDSDSVIDLFAAVLYGRPLTNETHALFANYVGSDALGNAQTRVALREAVAAMLMAPEFQWT